MPTSSPQPRASSLFLWRRHTPNHGDRESGWPLRFAFPAHDTLDLDTVERQRLPLDQYTRIVIGGGLLPDARWYPYVDARIRERPDDWLAIGVGTNDPDAPPPCRTYWRHIVPGQQTIPCPSCMSLHLMGATPPPTHALVAYANPHIDPLLDLDPDIPRLTNDSHGTLAEIIAHLASGAEVVTSSYHGAYWAALLGRRVTVRPGGRGKFADAFWRSVVGARGNVPLLAQVRAQATLGAGIIAAFLRDTPTPPQSCVPSPAF